MFIPRIANPVADRDATIYKVTLAYGSKESTVAVGYNPGDNISSLLTSGVDINTSFGGNYYDVRNYQDFAEIVNKALSTAFTNLSAQFPANTFATTTVFFFLIWILTAINSFYTPK